MSIYSSMYIGMSGMRSNEHAITVIGDNIANMNTIGFKSNRWSFSDMLSHQMIGPAGPFQVGQGAMVTGSQRVNLQGALLGTGLATDMAIAGNGYFISKGSVGGIESNFYSRSGQFTLDKEGFLAAPGGFRLQGFLADDNGKLGSSLGDLQVGQVTTSPSPTTALDIHVNLDAQSPVQTDAFDINNPEETSGFSSSVTTYDSLGNSHQMDVYFQKTAAGEWEYHVITQGEELEGGTEGELTEALSGTLTFNAAGKLEAHTQGNSSITFAGAESQEISISFGDPLSEGGTGNGSTGFGGESTVDFLQQDGSAVGLFQFLKVLQDGSIEGTFSNGEVKTLGRVALATFKNDSDLRGVGQNMLAETELSGEPLIGGADSGGRGEVFDGSLEQSNVDLTNEFTQLIVSQRGYQASSKLITTADQMLVETLNLKR
jgi:flagellar hook protein FlgE